MVRLLQQHHNRCHLYEGQEVAGRLLIAGGDATKMLDPIDEPLHQVPRLIQDAIVVAELLAVFPRRNRGTAGRASIVVTKASLS